MASAEHEPITGVWGQSPQRGPGQSPWSGGQSPPKAESILVIGCLTEPANLAPFQKCPVTAEHFYHSICYCVWIYQQQRIYLTENSMLCYGPLVSELAGPECMVPPNPVIGWGLCLPARLRRLCTLGLQQSTLLISKLIDWKCWSRMKSRSTWRFVNSTIEIVIIMSQFWGRTYSVKYNDGAWVIVRQWCSTPTPV